jgi:hypothetical protein
MAVLESHATVASAQRDLLARIAECDAEDAWRGEGARDLATWLSAEIGISNWAARRWVVAARALDRLPCTEAEFLDGSLCLDKVLELCRFATPEDEARLVTWAKRVTVASIRRKADAHQLQLQDVVEADRARYLRYWWFDDGTRLGLEGSLPADQGAVVVSALDRMAGRLPDIVDDADTSLAEDPIDVRRADALVALCSARIANDHDPDRATVVVHAPIEALAGHETRGACEVERGPVLHPETVRRLACDSRLQVVLHGGDQIVGVGRMSRTAPAWIHRVLRHRDGGCTFPGCEAKHFLHAHHIEHWIDGAPTNIDNLMLVCSFHHKLVHEMAWSVLLNGSVATWVRPSGKVYERPFPASEGDRAPPALFEVA